MGGRGTIGTRDFKYTNKEAIFNALKSKQLILTRNGKQITDAKNISNKELATLSVLAENLNNRGSGVMYNVIDIAPTKDNSIMSRSTVKKGETTYRKLTIHDKHMKQGYKHINNAYKKNGGLKQVVSKVLNKRPQQKTSGHPRVKKQTLDDFLAYAKSQNGK